MDMDIELLLAHSDDYMPVLADGLHADAAQDLPRPPDVPLPKELRHDGRDPNDLFYQRWGVIAPIGPLGDHLLRLIDPLIRVRCADQRGHEVKTYRVPPNMGPEAAEQWKQTEYWAEDVSEADLPKYLLIVGDADVVSWDLQQRMANGCFVGRIAFDTDRGYEMYVQKVLRWEKHVAAPAARALFYTSNDGTAATTIGRRALMEPTITKARNAKGSFPAQEILAFDDSLAVSFDDVLNQVARPDPAFLFTLSHGLGPPRAGWGSSAEQRALQGAMCLPKGQKLAAADLPSGPFLNGGLWFFLACYSAGTPNQSAYAPWIAQLKQAKKYKESVASVLEGLPKVGESPFVAALPKALLEKSDGPLGVIGHVDLAWTFGFRDSNARSRPSRFQGLFRSLVDGTRLGPAHYQIARFFADTSVELTTIYETEALLGAAANSLDKLAEKAHLWMVRQDLSAYVLLGDPAARLPIAQGAPFVSPAEIDTHGLGDFVRPDPSTANASQLEQAVWAVLGKDDAWANVAARFNVSEAELRVYAAAYQAAGRAELEKLLKKK